MTASGDRWNDALGLIQTGRLLEAESALRELDAEAALPAQGCEMLARLSYNRAVSIWEEDLTTAEALLREAMKLAPQLPNVRTGLAEILVRRAATKLGGQDWAAGAAGAMEAATLWPEIGVSLTEPVRSLALALQQSAVAIAGAHPLLATRLALSAWRLLPRDRDLYATCRSLFVHLGVGGLGPAIDAATFPAALRADPTDLVALLGLANLQRQARRRHEAEQLCRSALQYHPGNPFAVGRLASILFSGSRSREASHLYQAVGGSYGGVESVIRLTPEFFDALRAEPDYPMPASIPDEPREWVIFVGCDAKYFHRFADGLANSIARHCPSALLHFHVVNPDDAVATRIAQARERLLNLDIRLTIEQAPSALQGDALRTFFACARFLMLPELLRRYRCPVLTLDVDAVVLRNPQPLTAQLQTESADLAMVRGDQDEPWARYWADAIVAAPSARSLEYFDLVRRYIAHFLQRNQPIWFLDQIALCAARVAGFEGRTAPRYIDWPPDIQNSDTRLAYFWSLHMSQPGNSAIPESALYQSLKEFPLPR